jgi:alkylation response protein AidB-like acyl-CoA dehydrogenase
MASDQNNKEAMEIAEEARQKEWRSPSFAGEMFLGTFRPELLHPFPEQDPRDRAIGEAFADQLMSYLKTHLDPDLVDQTREIPREVIKEMGRMGVFAMKVPKEYGGLGFSQSNYNRVVQKVASYCGATAVLISAHQSIGVPQPLRLYGTEEQKRKFFPRFREGAISAFALTEVDVGSDPAQMSATATLSEDGKYYILNGSKLWCTNGVIADLIIVCALTEPKIVNGKEKKQISCFILEMNTPGVQVVHRCEFMGLSGIYNGLLRFHNVKIPKENLLGEEGRGLAMALATINVGRLTLPAACSGVGKLCLKVARKWGKERVQWGQPIGLHESGREKLAYIAATTFAIDAIAWLTSSFADKGNVDIRIEAAMAKMFSTEECWKITDMTMQLRGGRGYEKATSLKARGEAGYPIERAMRDVRVNTILEGSTEIMKLFLAREAMDPHLKRLSFLIKPKKGQNTLLEILKVAGHYALWYPTQIFKGWFTQSYKDFGSLAPYMKFVERTSHKLARTLFYYMARYQQKLEHRQLILGRLMEIGTDLFAICATCSFALCQQKKHGDEVIDLADYFCKMAKRRVEKGFSSLNDNDDRALSSIGKKVVEGKMDWLESGIVDLPKAPIEAVKEHAEMRR